MFRFEWEISRLIPKLGLKDNQGVIIEGFDFTLHMFDCLGDMIVVSCTGKNNDFKYILKESDTLVPLFVGNIVQFNGDYIIHKVGDLYWDTLRICKWWVLKRKIEHIIYKLRIIHRWKIHKKFKRAE